MDEDSGDPIMENQYRQKILLALKSILEGVSGVNYVTVDSSSGATYAGGRMPAIEIHWEDEDISYRITSHSRRSVTVKLVIHASSQVELITILDALDVTLEDNYTLDHTCIVCKPITTKREKFTDKPRNSVEHILEISYGRRTK